MQAAARQGVAAREPPTDAEDETGTSGAAAEQANGHSFADDMRGKAAAKRKAMSKDELPPPVSSGLARFDAIPQVAQPEAMAGLVWHTAAAREDACCSPYLGCQ